MIADGGTISAAWRSAPIRTALQLREGRVPLPCSWPGSASSSDARSLESLIARDVKERPIARDGPRAQVWTFSPMNPRDMANNVLACLFARMVAAARYPESIVWIIIIRGGRK